MIIKKIQNNRGFVILFAVTLSSILLSIALGVSNIALKEIKFGTSAKDTNDAFFAADTGIEMALFNDKSGQYVLNTPGTKQDWSFFVSGLGSAGVSCAKVEIFKDNTNITIPVITDMISKGYSVGDASCGLTNSDRVEREIEVSY